MSNVNIDLDKAIRTGEVYSLDAGQVKYILRAAGLEVPSKTAVVSIDIEVEAPDGRAVYLNNLRVTEKNGLPVRIAKTQNNRDNSCLVSN